ncbi:transcriptional repressor TCF25-domain-containing protein [Umbelopsis sp. PMI_123]|nr:transcriptional repressor TCF25-domain-containing protein [Umbelopsis sp. PMI_123]
MSSRALRKLQKDQGLAHLAETLSNRSDDHDASEESDGENETSTSSKPAKNLFDLLDEGSDDDEVVVEDEQEEDVPIQPVAISPSKKKNKKKKGKKAQKTQTVDSNQSSSPATTTKKSDVGDMTLEELDQLLRKETMGYAGEGATKSVASTNAAFVLRQALSVETKFLDADAEMKRMFGSKVVNKEMRERSHGRVLKKTRLASPKVDWSPYSQQGLSMRVIDSKDGITEFCYVQSESYQDAQLEFLECVESHDPNNIVLLNRYYPYHIDCLVQISEIAKHSGDWTVAGECIEKALYACERAFHPNFNISSGCVRLSYKYEENRSFFLGIHRHIQFLSRRGCWRTAFEFNKLLLSLDPTADPLCAKLSIDFYALKCNEHEYFLKLMTALSDSKSGEPDVALPNFAFSRAYAMFKLEAKIKKTEDNVNLTTESSEYLQKAILTYPMVVLGLAEKCGQTDSIITSHPLMSFTETSSPYLNLLIQLFVQRNFTLWKEPEVIAWLFENTHTALARFDANATKADEDVQAGLDVRTKSALYFPADVENDPHHGIPLNVSRHILISDIERLLAFIPDEIKQRSHHMHDPLPPPDSISPYQDVDTAEGRARQRTRRVLQPGARGNLVNMLNNLLGGAGGHRLGQEATQHLREMIGMLEQQQVPEIVQDRFPGAFPDEEEGIATPVEGFEHVEDAGVENANAAGNNGVFNLTSLRNTLNRYLYAQENGEDLPDLEESLSDDDIAVQMALQDTFNNGESPQEEHQGSQGSTSGQ